MLSEKKKGQIKWAIEQDANLLDLEQIVVWAKTRALNINKEGLKVKENE